MASYLLYRLFGWLVPLISPRFGYWLFARLGDVFYRLDTEGRRAVHDNLRHVLGPEVPDPVVDRRVKAMFRLQAYNYFDLFRLPAMSADEIERRVTVHGWEHLEAALATGKGVIVVSAHCGNVDVTLQLLGLRGVRATLVAERLKPERLFRYVVGIRAGYGITVVPAGASMKPLFRALRAGGVVALVLDRNVTGSGIEIEFFGEQAWLPDGYARLARRTGALIIVALALRLPDHQLRVRIEPPLEPVRTDDRTGDVRAVVRQVLDIAEKHIAEHPEQWVMFRPIWQSGDRGCMLRSSSAEGDR